MTLGPAECDVDIAALDIACLAETLTKRGLDGRGLTGRAGADKTDHRGRLLSVNRERPRCRRAANQRDELAPLHVCSPSRGWHPTTRRLAVVHHDWSRWVTSAAFQPFSSCLLGPQ